MRPALMALALSIASLAPATWASPVTRQALEARLDWMLDNRIADAELEVLLQRARLREAESGPHWFGSVGVSQVREPLSPDVVHAYSAVSAQVGVRVPLLGTADSEGRGRLSADAAVEQGRWQRDMVRAESLRALRLAYVEAVRREEQLALADGFLGREAEDRRVLARRRQAQLLTEPDYREFLTQFELARRDRAQLAAARAAARQQLSAMTELPLEEGLAPPGFRTDCLTETRLLAARERQPGIRLARARQAEQARLLRLRDAGAVDAGLVLLRSQILELGGVSGSSTYAGVDVRLPLDWQAAARARHGEAQAALERAELATRKSEQAFEAAARQADGALGSRTQALRFATARLESARAGLDGAGLRLRLADGDVIEKVLQARFALYRASQEQADAGLELEKAQVEALALAEECPGGEPGASPALGRDSATPLLPGGAGGADAVVSPPLNPAARRDLPGWYAWDGALWLARAEDPVWLSRIAARASRLMLSFDAGEIVALAGESPLAERLGHFLDVAHRQGLAVDLLLGDGAWLDPARRGDLLRHLRALSRFRFDGVNLDLERSQLPARDQANYPAWLVATLRAAAQASPWPVSLSAHYRDLADPALVRALRMAGLHELCLMVFVSNPRRLAQIVSPVFTRNPGLAIAIAQSVESELPAGESYAADGASQALAVLRDLQRSWQRYPNFSGLRVQSLEAYFELPP